MVYYVYRVCWNECDEEDTFETFEEAKEFVDQKTATGNPNYVSPFIYEVELVEQEDGTSLPTGDDRCVFSWDSQKDIPDVRNPKEYDEDEFDDFEIYDVFSDGEEMPEPTTLEPDGKLFDEDVDSPDTNDVDIDNVFKKALAGWDDSEPAEQAPEPTKNKKSTKGIEKRINKVISSWGEALDALNEADENEVECTVCHEMFPKEECLKECGKFICKNCQGNLTEDIEKPTYELYGGRGDVEFVYNVYVDIPEVHITKGAWDKPDRRKERTKQALVKFYYYPEVEDIDAALIKFANDPKVKDMSNSEWFDLVEKYYDQLLAYFEDDANIAAQEEVNDAYNRGALDNYKIKSNESLEDTVPEDLADDRTPKQGNVFELEHPVDYKAEIAKEKLVDEDLHEDLNQDIKKWNEYVKYLQEQIAKEEKALERAGENELVKKAIQRRIDAFKADLEEALPNIVKNAEPEISEVSDLDLDVEEKPAKEVKEEKKAENKKLKESFNQEELKRYLAAAEKLGIKTGADLMKFSREHGDVKDQALLDAMEAEANK